MEIDINKSRTPVQKKIWLLTYSPAGTYITLDILKKHGIVADECHSTSDTIMNYTYIHVPKRCRITTVEKLFTSLRSEYGIVKNDVFGYDCIGSKSKTPGSLKIQEHIVFKMLTAHSKEKQPSFSPCTDGEPVLSRGLLFHASEMIEDRSVPLESQTKTQLINYARRLEEKLKNFEAGTVQRTNAFTAYRDGKPVPTTTLATLLHYQRHHTMRRTMRRVSRLEERMNEREASGDISGEIYAAWNPVMPSLFKMGFTFKDAKTRVRALQTAGVLKPFKLVRHAKVPDARYGIIDARVFLSFNFFCTGASKRPCTSTSPACACTSARSSSQPLRRMWRSSSTWCLLVLTAARRRRLSAST